ncbi:helix-turn-helix transcriptional regulator [Antrihabitans sp. YC3-6]|uniref:Helix-turn-helix transcriptional regulator n=1 Tax=Antrihabitans stalagmiti TaxID=2799499 RepID=A0A934NWY0_9NOCA|nr:helix-turn-helix transcriptional regulator [Antrihabitans stalagmiti]MBJ8342820.1 helix-turn-helix transcriptional regulator [Antrihabitans stalagmiti]
MSDLLNSQPVTARQAAAIAERLGIHLPYGTIAAYWSGRHGRPSLANLERLAQVLSLSIRELQLAAWDVSAPLGEYQPPEEANLLDQRQRQALDELIKSIAASQGGTARDSRFKSPLSSSPQSGAPSETNEDQEAKPVDLTEKRNENRRNTQAARADIQWPAPDPVVLAEGPDGKGEALNTPDQADDLDDDADEERWAARKGESKERRRRRLTTAPEDEPQGEAPEGGA